MAISNTPRDAISTYQVLLEIAQALKTLTADPDALAKAATDAYTLPEAEKAKAEKAKEVISTMESLVAEQKRRQQDIGDSLNELDAKKAENDNKLRMILEGNKKLEALRKELDEITIEQNSSAKSLASRERDLLEGIDRLKVNNADLEARRQMVNDYEAALKDKAAKFAEFTKGL